MSSGDLSLSSISNDELKVGGGGSQEISRSHSKERRHKHKKKHKRHSHKHKHRHKSSTRKEKKHKKHRSKHRQKDSGSESGAEVQDGEDMELIDNLLEAGLERTVAPPRQAAASAAAAATAAGRDVEIRHATAGNGVIESMKIVVNNRNGTDEQPVTVSSSDDEMTEPHAVSEENSREAARKAEEFTLDSSDFLHIDEDLNLEELMKQKAALQACLGAYMSDMEDEDNEATVMVVQKAPPPAPKPAAPMVSKPPQEVVTIEDSDDAGETNKKKERRKEKETRPKKRKRSSQPSFPWVLPYGAAVASWGASLQYLSPPG